ncbi:hypothetical protein QR66_18235, partial [Chromobacterium piscinae]
MGGGRVASPARCEPTLSGGGVTNALAGGEFLADWSSVSRTGVNVNELTAMQHGAVYACVQLLAG